MADAGPVREFDTFLTKAHGLILHGHGDLRHAFVTEAVRPDERGYDTINRLYAAALTACEAAGLDPSHYIPALRAAREQGHRLIDILASPGTLSGPETTWAYRLASEKLLDLADHLTVTRRPAAPVSDPSGPGRTKPLPVMLKGWDRIFSVLNEGRDRIEYRNDERTKRHLREMNDTHNGPIEFPKGRGKQPSVEKYRFIEWFDKMCQTADATRSANQSAGDLAARGHPYGDGIVLPEIGGAVRPGRRRRKN